MSTKNRRETLDFYYFLLLLFSHFLLRLYCQKWRAELLLFAYKLLSIILSIIIYQFRVLLKSAEWWNQNSKTLQLIYKSKSSKFRSKSKCLCKFGGLEDQRRQTPKRDFLVIRCQQLYLMRNSKLTQLWTLTRTISRLSQKS